MQVRIDKVGQRKHKIVVETDVGDIDAVDIKQSDQADPLIIMRRPIRLEALGRLVTFLNNNLPIVEE